MNERESRNESNEHYMHINDYGMVHGKCNGNFLSLFFLNAKRTTLMQFTILCCSSSASTSVSGGVVCIIFYTIFSSSSMHSQYCLF